MLSAKDKGHAIGNSDKIRIAHNSFTRQDPFFMEEDTKAATDDDDVFHFISFVPVNGQLYELDGLQPGPISFGSCTTDDWLGKAREQIQARIQKYSETEVRFNLLAITGDKLTKFETERKKLGQCQNWIQKKLAGEAIEGDFSLAQEQIEVY
jgi:ubiquitin carboxyl-terminal hydrolase L5